MPVYAVEDSGAEGGPAEDLYGGVSLAGREKGVASNGEGRVVWGARVGEVGLVGLGGRWTYIYAGRSHCGSRNGLDVVKKG